MRGVSAAVVLAALGLSMHAAAAQQHYLGFDRNAYPGDALLPALHQQFAYTGFWLNPPPDMATNPWAGKRRTLRDAGFGFLILFNGRLDRALRRGHPAALGTADGLQAAASARREGFPRHALIFLDLEEGGRMLPEQLAYIGAWLAAVRAAGFETGIYCSGIDVPEGSQSISTARDLAAHFPHTALWVANDQCPPSSGCVARPAAPSASGTPAALVWQFAQSPRRAQYTAACAATYAPDGNCYGALPHSPGIFLDLDTSYSPDPSHGR